jgi:pyruvate formate lyase activating enzyme
LNGIITHIQRYSIHDGPGIRTVVFFKGCPLACLWCCNPETQSFQPELEFVKNLCQQCGRCLQVCPELAVNPDLNCHERDKINRKKCTLCKKCIQACTPGALKIIGEPMSLDDVLATIQKDAAFYRRSGGGVTLSGGEPLSQPEFAFQLLKKCHELNIHTAIETCGLVNRQVFERIFPFTDLFLFDIKYLNPKRHQELTGSSNEQILANLHWLSQKNANIILRLPMIPSINMDTENFQGIAGLINDLGIKEVNLMPFHQMGKDKYSHLGKDYRLKDINDLRLDEKGKKDLLKARELLCSMNVIMTIGG